MYLFVKNVKQYANNRHLMIKYRDSLNQYKKSNSLNFNKDIYYSNINEYL